MGRYDDIINLDRPEPIRERMPLSVRGAQFAPFAALKGYDEAISETTRATSAFREPDENDLKEISIVISSLMMRNLHALVEISYFVPDSKKEGGIYKSIRGEIRRIDEVAREIILKSGQKISFQSLHSLKIVDEFL